MRTQGHSGRLTLHGRFLLALAPLLLLLACGFAISSYLFYATTKTETVDNALIKRMDQFVQRFAERPDLPLPAMGGFTGFMTGNPLSPPIPAALLSQEPDRIHHGVQLDGKSYFLLHREIGGRDFYLLLDDSPTRAIRNRMVLLIAGNLAFGFILALLCSHWMARQINRPVQALAAAVKKAGASPEAPPCLSQRFHEPDVAEIADAFDQYALRLSRFIEREHAFTEDASHELRTPLTIIRSSAQLLSEDESISHASQLRIARILRASAGMQALLEALLWISRENVARQMPLIDLGQLIDETVQGHQENLRHRPVELVFRNQSQQPRPVAHGMAASIIGNLLQNALQFTERGTVCVTLTDQMLSVEDSGHGIPAPDLEHIFERRYRGAQSRGQGLGLYIVSRMCTALGWTISAERASGPGARFVIRFPDNKTTENAGAG